MGKDGHTSLSLYAGLALFLQTGCQPDQHIRVEQGLFQLFGREVAAVLTDGGKDLSSQPLLERQGLGLVRAPEEKIQALFSEHNHLLRPGGGHNGCDPPPFCWNMCNPGIAVPFIT